MILGMIGVLLIIFSVVGDNGVRIAGVIIGVIVLIIGLISISASEDRFRARNNRKRYWAYGEDPDWARDRRSRK